MFSIHLKNSPTPNHDFSYHLMIYWDCSVTRPKGYTNGKSYLIKVEFGEDDKTKLRAYEATRSCPQPKNSVGLTQPFQDKILATDLLMAHSHLSKSKSNLRYLIVVLHNFITVINSVQSLSILVIKLCKNVKGIFFFVFVCQEKEK